MSLSQSFLQAAAKSCMIMVNDFYFQKKSFVQQKNRLKPSSTFSSSFSFALPAALFNIEIEWPTAYYFAPQTQNKFCGYTLVTIPFSCVAHWGIKLKLIGNSTNLKIASPKKDQLSFYVCLNIWVFQLKRSYFLIFQTFYPSVQ